MPTNRLFVAQERPLYGRFKVSDLLELGRRLNPRWDEELAQSRMNRLGIPLERRAAQLSGGQRAQVALTMVLHKRPDMLLLDEGPLPELDPLARREFLQDLMEAVADKGLSVVLSSHIVSELERTCDYLVILADGQIQVAGDIDALVNQHRILVGPRAASEVESDPTVIRFSQGERLSTLLVRTDGRGIGSEWEVHQVSLEDIVLAYLSRPMARSMPRPELVEAAAGRIMTWVAWRQHSREAALASGILVLIAAFLVFEWIRMSSVSGQLGLAACQGDAYVGTACGAAARFPFSGRLLWDERDRALCFDGVARAAWRVCRRTSDCARGRAGNTHVHLDPEHHANTGGSRSRSHCTGSFPVVTRLRRKL